MSPEQIPAWFVAVLTEYLAAWGQTINPTLAGSYWATLEDRPEAEIRAASLQLRRAERRSEFPPPAPLWHAACVLIGREAAIREAVVPARDEPWHAECETCEDTGWDWLSCPGDGSCGRRAGHGAHSYVMACACRESNRTYRRKHA